MSLFRDPRFWRALRAHSAYGPVRAVAIAILVGVIVISPHFFEWSASTIFRHIALFAIIGAIVGYLFLAPSRRLRDKRFLGDGHSSGGDIFRGGKGYGCDDSDGDCGGDGGGGCD